MPTDTVTKAFILGAGLGTRLRPLTNKLPKPLVPVWNAPLITFALDHIIHDLGTSQFMINTHHAAKQYGNLFPDNSYRDCSLEFRHEPVLLDTAGGIDNIRDWLPDSTDEPFLVYNGDILTDLPLGPAVAAHRASGDLVTLILRSTGENGNVAFNPRTKRIKDMRNALETNSKKLYQFTGIYVVSPEFLIFLEPGKIESIVMPMLTAIRDWNRVGGIIIDDGHWSDLGDEQSYLDALPLLKAGKFPSFGLNPNKCRIHSSAQIDPTAKVDEFSTIGQNATIEAGANVTHSVVWPHAKVTRDQTVERTVILP